MALKATVTKLTGNPQQDIKLLANHVFMLEEQLRYELRNLDVTNFNDLGLARYENGRLQVYSEIIEAKTKELRIELNGEISAASIVAKINATTGSSIVKINADHIEMTGTTTFLKSSDLGDSGSTSISGNRINSGEINSVNVVMQGSFGYNGRGILFKNRNGAEYARIGATSLSGYENDLTISTSTNRQTGYAAKLELLGEGGVSINSGENITQIVVNGTIWEFGNNAIYANGIPLVVIPN